ncbi:MAG: DUF2846 domain-containing protein [Terracidiphilus sp.]
MKLRLFALFLCLSIAVAAMAKEIELPDSCGDTKTKFDVTTQKSATALPAPDANKALIVFIQPYKMACIGGCLAPRFAMDGQWVGATHAFSYFTLQVEPGQHHFCSTGQTPNEIAIRSFEVKAGMTYFLQARLIISGPLTEEEHESQVLPAGKRSMLFGMSLLDEEKGRYLIKSYEVAEFKKK